MKFFQFAKKSNTLPTELPTALIILAKMQGFIKIKIHSIQPNENLKISTLLGQIKIVALEKLIQSDRNVEEVIFNCFK